jgi:hypothetical protein
MRKSDDLKAEYVLIQTQYEAFDQRALSMKALATPCSVRVLPSALRSITMRCYWRPSLLRPLSGF